MSFNQIQIVQEKNPDHIHLHKCTVWIQKLIGNQLLEEWQQLILAAILSRNGFSYGNREEELSGENLLKAPNRGLECIGNLTPEERWRMLIWEWRC